MAQQAEHSYREQDADGYMPGDNLLPQHIGQAYQQGEGTDFTDGTSTIVGASKKQVPAVRKLL